MRYSHADEDYDAQNKGDPHCNTDLTGLHYKNWISRAAILHQRLRADLFEGEVMVTSEGSRET